jgi:hypothetical protein
MNPCFPGLFAGTQADFSTFRRHLSLNQLTKLRPALSRSANQFEQLVGKQDHDAKREVEPDLLGAPHHDVVTPKLFLQTAVKPLRTVRLMGRQRDTLSPPAILIDRWGRAPGCGSRRRSVGRHKPHPSSHTDNLSGRWSASSAGWPPGCRAGRPGSAPH